MLVRRALAEVCIVPMLLFIYVVCLYVGGHWLVQMEWRRARWSGCLRLLVFPCTIESRSSLLAPARPGGPGKMTVMVVGVPICYTVCPIVL